MSDLIPIEKLQPCLLDRLTDDDPQNTQESRAQRIVSLHRYKAGVLRDLEWLINASAHLPEEGKKRFCLADFPQAHRSVLNFGTRQLCGLVAPDMKELEREMTEALRLFEPRIIRNSVQVTATLERNIIGIEIRGELWADPIPEQLFLKTQVDLETGQCILGDATNG